MDAIAATMVDVVFPLDGESLPRDHRKALADALERALPWLADWPGRRAPRQRGGRRRRQRAAVAARAPGLRVPREQVQALAPLAGATLDVAGHSLRLGPPHAARAACRTARCIRTW